MANPQITPGMEKVSRQIDAEMVAVPDMKQLDHQTLAEKVRNRILGPLPDHAPSMKPMSELTKCPGIPTLYPQQCFRLTGEYLLLRVTDITEIGGIGHHIAWVEDEAGVISPLALWNYLDCHLAALASKEGPFIFPPVTFGLFPPVIMIKEPFVHGSRRGITAIWALHWTSDLVWVGRHADYMPKHWRRGPEPGNEADFWIEKAMKIVGTNVLRSELTEEAWLKDVLCIDQALRFDLSDTREDGQELWFQFTKARAVRLALLEFGEEALFGFLQSWPLNRFTEMPPSGKGKGKGKGKKEPFTNPLETCALRYRDRRMTAFFRPAERTCFESPRCRNLAALARQLCLESEVKAFDPMLALRIVEILCRLGHVTIAAEILDRARARDPRILSKSTKAFQSKIFTQLQQCSTPDAVFKLTSGLNMADTEMGLYRKSVRLRRLKAPRRGRGLFTNRAVKAGDCLLCERSMVACETKTPIEDDTVTSMEANLDDVLARLSYLLLNYVLHSPSSAAQLAKFSLKGGGEPTVNPRLVVDGRPVVDGRLVERIVEQKTIDCLMISDRGEARVVSGVWFMASFIDRDPSGVPNVNMEMTDDVLKVDALLDLPRGTELVAAPQLPPRDFRGKKSGKVTLGFRGDSRKLTQNILRSIRRAAGIPAPDSAAAGRSAGAD